MTHLMEREKKSNRPQPGKMDLVDQELVIVILAEEQKLMHKVAAL